MTSGGLANSHNDAAHRLSRNLQRQSKAGQKSSEPAPVLNPLAAGPNTRMDLSFAIPPSSEFAPEGCSAVDVHFDPQFIDLFMLPGEGPYLPNYYVPDAFPVDNTHSESLMLPDATMQTGWGPTNIDELLALIHCVPTPCRHTPSALHVPFVFPRLRGYIYLNIGRQADIDMGSALFMYPLSSLVYVGYINLRLPVGSFTYLHLPKSRHFFQLFRPNFNGIRMFDAPIAAGNVNIALISCDHNYIIARAGSRPTCAQHSLGLPWRKVVYIGPPWSTCVYETQSSVYPVPTLVDRAPVYGGPERSDSFAPLNASAPDHNSAIYAGISGDEVSQLPALPAPPSPSIADSP
ncbi:hypothetical protein C8R45DRAFT_1220449 [Mycena sanguinolenta]|nr:hypothetical protein C8R45DRAFT_1220449 [Mycena sanguinolenta]